VVAVVVREELALRAQQAIATRQLCVLKAGLADDVVREVELEVDNLPIGLRLGDQAMRIVECVDGCAAGTVDDAKQVSFGAVVVANMSVLNGAITGMLPDNAAL